MCCPVYGAVNLSLLEEAIAGRIWGNVSPHEANGGLEGGEPDLKIHKKIIDRLLQGCKVETSRALESIVSHSTWAGERAHPHEPELAVCTRCGKANETFLHRYWLCSDSTNCFAKCVNDTQHLSWQVEEEHELGSSFWLDCILPRAVSLPRPLKISRSKPRYE